jgi:hypothetical protein
MGTRLLLRALPPPPGKPQGLVIEGYERMARFSCFPSMVAHIRLVGGGRRFEIADAWLLEGDDNEAAYWAKIPP